VDQDILVSSGHKLIDLLAAAKMDIRAAVWIHAPETDTWRFWIVPEKSVKDKREFYRRAAEVISKNRDTLSNIDISDTEFVTESHPAIAALKRMFKAKGHSTIQLEACSLNGFFISRAIILQMDF
jgi:hypothetical protein